MHTLTALVIRIGLRLWEQFVSERRTTLPSLQLVTASPTPARRGPLPAGQRFAMTVVAAAAFEIAVLLAAGEYGLETSPGRFHWPDSRE